MRHGNLEQDDTISLVIEGRPPATTRTQAVCATLAATISSADEVFTASVSGDATLTIAR